MQKLNSIYFERKPSLEIKSLLCNMQTYFENNPEKFEIFKISILVSSPSLYKEWKKVNFQFCNSKINLSLYKFYKRASTRSTPYGLFSTVCLINEDDEETTESLIAYFSPDASWLDSLVSKLESAAEVLKHLKLSINPLAEINKERIILHHSEEKVIYLNEFLSFVIEAILENGEIDCSDLYRFLADNVDGTVQPTVLFGYLCNLINKGLLITNLRKTLIKADSLQDIIDILSENDSAKIYCNKLKNIQKLFQIINEIDLVESRSLIEKIMEKMEKLALSDNYISAIGRHSSTYSTALNSEIINDVRELNEFLFNLYMNFYEIEKVDNFKHQFIEKYGTNVRIPVLKCRNLITQKNFNNLQKHHSIVDMVIGDVKTINLENFKDYFQNKELPSSLSSELNICIVRTSDDEYSLEVAPAVGTSLMGKMIGRFYTVFTEKQKEMYSTLVECNKKLYEHQNCRLVNLEALYEKPVLYNVCNKYSHDYHKVFYSYNIFNNYDVLRDIYAHIDSNYDLIFTNSEGQPLKFIINSALNPKANDLLMDFLVNYNNNGSSAFALGIIKNFFSSSNYIPEIKYKDIVIVPRTWRFFDTEKITFESFIKLNKIPNFVYMVMNNDNRLLLNLSKKEDYDILLKQVKKYRNVELQEVNQMIVSAIRNHFECKISEVVFEFENNSEVLNQLNFRYNLFPIYQENEIRMMDFSSQWIYIKLYVSENRQKDFLLRYYQEISIVISDKFKSEVMFYIRYNDPEPHIRFRIKASSIENKCDIENYLFKKLQSLLESKIIDNYSQNIYIRELERYGGENCIDIVENIFSINSKLAVQLLARNKGKDLDELKCDLIVCIYEILKVFTYTDNEIMGLYSNINDEEAKCFFHAYKNQVLNGALNINQYFSTDICDLLHSHDKFNQICLLRSNDKRRIDEIAKSIIHMFCNRVFGTNRNIEKIVLSCVEKIVYAKIGYEKAHK